ncbi:unnamed protein product [Vitrella brassicaformis CCMP3155]|uniref:Uncharacterized protein n=1 Tax=Vitrella brassicaformis (strain CCMP3155) TaxID=1169540 RepID=A0A0G4EW02_VITBC|nr:unnamed protein product [Vitrella brassicaformis CCMP3155]|eukprot:CEM02277.1 unnamed protein product [Vitrella brassicaformis CCMP3155]
MLTHRLVLPRSTKAMLKQHVTTKKMKKYRSAICDSRMTFCPLVVTCDGVWGHDGCQRVHLIAHMAHALWEKEGGRVGNLIASVYRPRACD